MGTKESVPGIDSPFWTQSRNFAAAAFRFSGGAAATAVPDEEMGKEGPVRLRHDFDQGLFHFHGIVLTGQAHAAGEPPDMGVHDDALSQVEGVAENHVGGLSSHARQLVEVFHGLRDLPAVVLDQGGGTTAD